MTPRGLELGDRERWFDLWAGYLRFYETDLDDAVTRVVWDRLTDPASPIVGRVVEDDTGRIAGFVHCVYHPITWAVADACYLEDLFVDPNARGQGYGRALIEAVIADARARTLSRVYWMTKADNATARRLYDRIAGPADGFVRYTVRS